MHQTYEGSCHCGRVRFQLQGEIRALIDCNCSLCRRRGALWHGASDADLNILSGESELVLYQFNTMTAKHYFCRHCGMHPFARPRIAPTAWVVNVRCLEGVDSSALPVQHFDGEHWEEAAHALQVRMHRQTGS